jgi:hypothetical protein
VRTGQVLLEPSLAGTDWRRSRRASWKTAGVRHQVLPLLVAATTACSSSANDSTADVSSNANETPPTPPKTEPSTEARPHHGVEHDPPPHATPALGECAGGEGVTLRTLVVGNSQIYFQNLPKLLTDLAQSAPPACPRIAAEPFTRGGQNLNRLWNGGDSSGRDLATVIREGGYDVVVISECIDIVELDPPYENFAKYANLIIDAARASGALPVLYATPYVRKSDRWGYREMAAPQIELGRARNVRVAAGGLAWLRVWNELPTVELHHPDAEHPGYKGSIVSAMVIYAVITRGTPIGLTKTPPIDCDTPRPWPTSSCPPLTPAEGDVFQRAAWAEALATGMVISP